MTAIYIVCFILMVIGVCCILNLTPDQINQDITELLDKQQTLKDQALAARGKKKKNGIRIGFERMRRALQ